MCLKSTGNVPGGIWKSGAGHALQSVGEGLSQAGVLESEEVQNESLIREEFVGFLSFLLACFRVLSNV